MIWCNLKEQLQQWAARLILLDTISSTSANGESERSNGHSGASDDPDVPQPLKRRGPYGLAWRPPNGAEIAQFAAAGSSNNRFYTTARVPGKEPELEIGEVKLWSIDKQAILLEQGGRILIDSESTKDVVVNGGSKKVARVDDDVDCGTLRATTTQVSVMPPILGVTITYQPPGAASPNILLQLEIPGGISVSPVVGATNTVPVPGNITTGADHFKA